MKNHEDIQLPEAASTAQQAEVALVKAYRIETNTGTLWLEKASDVACECLDDEEHPLLTLEAVAAMQPGDRLQVPGWSVFCSMVDPNWLAELPEHDGW